MNAQEFRDSLQDLGLSQAEAARLLGVKLRTVQRWAAGRPAVGEPAAQALKAWRRLAERGIAWRPDGEPVEAEDLRAIAEHRRAELAEMLRRNGGPRGPWRRRWRINIERCRATSPAMVVHFNRLADGSFLPASYRRLEEAAEGAGDRSLLEEATAAFLDVAARAEAAGGILTTRDGEPAADPERRPVLEEAPA